MSLPQITHLQFLILGVLVAGEAAGQRIRTELEKQRVKKSGPAFYQLMARLEDAKLVDGWYVERMIDGQRIKERHYKITGKGAKLFDATREFYERCSAIAQGGLAYGSGA